MESGTNISIHQIDHHGLVAGMCEEIGLVDCINSYINKPQRKVSVGHAVKAMVLNGLGFTGRALYHTPEFFQRKAVSTLVGPGIQAEDLHDDSLGTALDALYDQGITELFYNIAAKALKTQGIEYRFVHLDSTTFSLHGEYGDQDSEHEQLVTITKGLSKDRAPDLNQVVTTLMCSYRSTIPIWLEVLSGNASDKRTFRESIKQYRAQFTAKDLPYFIADSALYSKASLQDLAEIKWVTRVPETIKEAKNLVDSVDPDNMKRCSDPNYRFSLHDSDYADIRQRWVIVYSQKAYDREMHTFKMNLEKARVKAEKDLWHLGNQAYACEADARKAAGKFEKSLRWHSVDFTVEPRAHYAQKGRPAKDASPVGTKWYISGTIVDDELSIAKTTGVKGKFIVATNELDSNVLSDEALIEVYKAQGVSVERGFRFLKDPLFYAESLYLNSPKRIMALIMVMGLSLLVYSLLERKLRSCLKSSRQTIPNQVKKATDNPTLRWVFQFFVDLSIVHFGEGPPQAANLDERHITVITSLGRAYEKIYFLR
ncbi:MAG: IS1634 family transposase [Bacteroidetes bacterium]|jgi:transposase|nr:IS1634 family transposase [Bacteroidota bacterium]